MTLARGLTVPVEGESASAAESAAPLFRFRPPPGEGVHPPGGRTAIPHHPLHGSPSRYDAWWLLTEVTQFDNYRTVPTKPSPTVQLQPGQFERIAKALSDPRRFSMLEAIGASCGCPNQLLCQDFPVSKATVSHHLRELVQAGLVETEREGQYLSARARPDVLKAYADELVRRVTGST